MIEGRSNDHPLDEKEIFDRLPKESIDVAKKILKLRQILAEIGSAAEGIDSPVSKFGKEAKEDDGPGQTSTERVLEISEKITTFLQGVRTRRPDHNDYWAFRLLSGQGISTSDIPNKFDFEGHDSIENFLDNGLWR